MLCRSKYGSCEAAREADLYLDNNRLSAHWTNTSLNSLAGKLVQRGSSSLKTAFERLLQGGAVTVQLDEQIVYDQLDEKEPECFYYGFVLGLMVELADGYTLTSNRESGFGRYDVMLERGKEGKEYQESGYESMGLLFVEKRY